MAHAIIHFLEGSSPRATLCRLSGGEPTGENGVMNLLGAFINELSPLIVREGSPGALKLAMIFVAREQEAGREVRVVGGEGALGIRAEEVQRLEGEGYIYEVSLGAAGERTLPTARARSLHPDRPAPPDAP